MTTVINNPEPSRNSEGSGIGAVIGAIIVILVLIAAVLWFLPSIRTNTNSINPPADNPVINVDLPDITIPSTSTTNIE